MKSSFRVSLLSSDPVVVELERNNAHLAEEFVYEMFHGEKGCFNDEIRFFSSKPLNVEDLFSRGRVYTICGNGTIIGIVCISESKDLSCLCIHSQYRKKGFGTLLIDFLKKKHNRLNLSVFSPKNYAYGSALQDMYKKHGFTCGKREGAYVHMSWNKWSISRSKQIKKMKRWINGYFVVQN